MQKQGKQKLARYKIETDYIHNTQRSYVDICQFLKNEPNLDLRVILDKKGNTGLHSAAYRTDGIKLLKKYLDYMEKYCSKIDTKDPQAEFKAFVDQANHDGMTALHMACYKGNYKALDQLTKAGADYKKLTSTNQNVLHVAAQGGHLEAFIFFEALVDINSLDDKNSTPLHWACYMGDQSIISYLLTHPNIKINEKDHSLQTPLHLATSYGFTKIVKLLLRAGADRHHKNFQGKTAYDIAKENQFKTIEKILNDKYSCYDRFKILLNLKTVYEPQARSFQKPIFFIFLFLLAVLFRMFLFTEEEGYRFMKFIQIAFFSIILVLYISLILSPKKKQPQKYIDFLNAQINFKNICLPCANIKPNRSNHCDVCKMCFQQYDHHCFWINNCVYKKNLKRFVLFIVLFQILLFYFLSFSIIVLYILYENKQLIIKRREILPKEVEIIVDKIFAYIIGIFSFCFSFPMIALITVQIKNLFLNKTTYERYTRDRTISFSRTSSSSKLLKDQIMTKEEKKYSFSNAISMCKGEELEDETGINGSITSFQ